MQKIKVSSEPRTSFGKGGAREIRRSKRIPAVLYGGDKIHHFSVTHNEIKNLVYTPDFKAADIELDGKTYAGFIKEIQFHPVTEEIVHVDFLSLTPGKKVNVEIPVRFKGVSPGVKNGGIFVQQMRKVKVKTTPESLVDELFIDISELKLGHAVRVKDIEIGPDMEIMNNLNIPVANVETPRALKSAEAKQALEEGEEGEAEGEREETESDD